MRISLTQKTKESLEQCNTIKKFYMDIYAAYHVKKMSTPDSKKLLVDMQSKFAFDSKKEEAMLIKSVINKDIKNAMLKFDIIINDTWIFEED